MTFPTPARPITLIPTKRTLTSISIPDITLLRLPPPTTPWVALDQWHETALDFYEWLALVSLGSPR